METAEAEGAASALIALGYGLLRDERKYQSRDVERPQNRIQIGDVYHSAGGLLASASPGLPTRPEGLSRGKSLILLWTDWLIDCWNHFDRNDGVGSQPFNSINYAALLAVLHTPSSLSASFIPRPQRGASIRRVPNLCCASGISAAYLHQCFLSRRPVCPYKDKYNVIKFSF